VFFDNIQLIHTRGPLLEETHYYPFGLAMSGISSKAAGKLQNRYKYNGCSELENQEFNDGSGLELYATDFRSYDPQIGRFHQVDMLTELNENWSPYSFAQNNPILYNDPFGLDTVKVGVKAGQTTGSATNADGSTGTYKIGENGAEGTGMNGSGGDATVTSTRKSGQKRADTGTDDASFIGGTGLAPAPTASLTPPNNNNRGRREADFAMTYPGRDLRPYSMSDAANSIDCSRFTREVANHTGYNIPRVAYDQALWYQRNGHWDNNVNNAQLGDHIFWQRGTNAYHTGIVVSNIMATNGVRIIRVAQSQVHSRPGFGSVQFQKLMTNGAINGFNQPFVGLGRYP
jgi:RHS repeat-associated protein